MVPTLPGLHTCGANPTLGPKTQKYPIPFRAERGMGHKVGCVGSKMGEGGSVAYSVRGLVRAIHLDVGWCLLSPGYTPDCGVVPTLL